MQPSGEVDARATDVDRQRADRMTQVPQHEGTTAVGYLGHLRHVVHVPALEHHVGQREQRGVHVEPADETVHGPVDTVDRRHDLQIVSTEQVQGAPQHVQIGRKVQVIGHDPTTTGLHAQRRDRKPEEVHRR